MKPLCLALILAVFSFVPASSGKVANLGKGLNSATILIIRHAEKPDIGTGLSPAGQQRASAYVKYFKNFMIDAAPVRISALYAAADSSESRRSRLTLQPLSQALRLGINTSYKNLQFPSLVTAIKSKPAGLVSLICWHHGTIADLIKALGGDPAQLLPDGKWRDRVYDATIVLRYDKLGNLIDARYLNQNLMPGDLKSE
ncbi:hypothetical protein BH09VER1_BH09VER1_22180 [soil metagenome]